MRTRDPRSDEESLDTFYHGRILVRQRRRGYRFAVDAPLLASVVDPGPSDELLELGTGSGIISLLLSVRPFRRITALEIQPGLAGLAARNVRLNRLGRRIRVVRGDLRSFRPRKRFDIVFSNPPYIGRHQGPLSESAEKSVAKHEIKCDILEVMRAAAALLKGDGRAYFVYPVKRRRDFERAAAEAGLGLAWVKPVRPRRGEPANLFLARCGFGRGKAKTLSPITLFRAGGGPTAAARRIFAGKFNA